MSQNTRKGKALARARDGPHPRDDVSRAGMEHHPAVLADAKQNHLVVFEQLLDKTAKPSPGESADGRDVDFWFRPIRGDASGPGHKKNVWVYSRYVLTIIPRAKGWTLKKNKPIVTKRRNAERYGPGPSLQNSQLYEHRCA